MRIRVGGIELEVECTLTRACPAGTGYWSVDYLLDGVCVHKASSGAIWGRPDVVAMLDSVIGGMRRVPVGAEGAKHFRQDAGKVGYWHTCEAAEAEMAEMADTRTHREAIVEGLACVVGLGVDVGYTGGGGGG
jgi:hypothetical protein